MSRIELGGKGDPIPLIALPDPNLDENLPPQVFVVDGVFDKTDWVGLGYTHYEVWCVGAAGGAGGAEINQVIWAYSTTPRVMTGPEWTLWLERVRVENYFTAGGVWDHVYSWSHPSQPGKTGWTAVEMEIANNPSHLLPITTYTGATLHLPSKQALGGAGGGGGVQVVAGTLADLDTETLAVAGVAGAEGAPGQTQVNGLWTPLPEWWYRFPTSGVGYPTSRLYELYNYFRDLQYFYPEPRSSFAVPQVGTDGGASSFGDDICVASGGKGGKQAKTWSGSAFVYAGGGGDGGLGDTDVAGGGGAGAPSGTPDTAPPGSDGVWDPSTGIGGGGGGGRSGSPGTPAGEFGYPPATPGRAASNGGRGNFSFADTTIFGDRQLAVGKVGGSGGGAKLIGDRKYGGRAPGYSPNGLVVIRLTAILD